MSDGWGVQGSLSAEGRKDKVKRPEEPLTKSLGPETSSILIFDNK